MSEQTNHERILVQSEILFMQYGIRSVTMDDLSRALSISKKTIYQHFKDKDEIVLKVSERVFAKEQQALNHMHEQGENVIHEMVLISKHIREHVSSTNPAALHDLQKFYKEAWEVFLSFQQECVRLIEEIITKGITEGYFRSSINAHVLAVFRTESISLSFDQRLFPQNKFDPREVQTQLFDQFLNGLLTDKGRRLYYQYSEKSITV